MQRNFNDDETVNLKLQNINHQFQAITRVIAWHTDHVFNMFSFGANNIRELFRALVIGVKRSVILNTDQGSKYEGMFALLR